MKITKQMKINIRVKIKMIENKITIKLKIKRE